MDRSVIYRYYIGKEYGYDVVEHRKLEFINITSDSVICEFSFKDSWSKRRYSYRPVMVYTYKHFEECYDISIKDILRESKIKEIKKDISY